MICTKDDSGTPCKDCLCMFNPVVLIATHQRIEITTININLLKQQSPKIIIVCSLSKEFEHYKTLGVNVILEANRPLGKKWQAGVNLANKMNANPLIILGSDDLLSTDYISTVLTKIKQGIDFIGSNAWYSLDKKINRLYSSRYINRNESFPIGSGRTYSKAILDKIRWKLFDTSAERRLDDLGYNLINSQGAKIHLIKEPLVLAIKSGVNEMNNIEAYLRSPNIKSEFIQDQSVLNQRFNYV